MLFVWLYSVGTDTPQQIIKHYNALTYTIGNKQTSQTCTYTIGCWVICCVMWEMMWVCARYYVPYYDCDCIILTNVSVK